MAQENEDRLHAAISLTTAQANQITIVASSGVDRAQFVRIGPGVYQVRLVDGVTDTEVSIGGMAGVNFDASAQLIMTVVRIPDPNFDFFGIALLNIDTGEPEDGTCWVQWWKIKQEAIPPTVITP